MDLQLSNKDWENSEREEKINLVPGKILGLGEGRGAVSVHINLASFQ